MFQTFTWCICLGVHRRGVRLVVLKKRYETKTKNPLSGEYNSKSYLGCPGLIRADTPDSAPVRCDDAESGVCAQIKPG